MTGPESEKIVATSMMHLIQTATKNGVITEHERILLSEFDHSLQYYAKELNKVMDQDKISYQDERSLNRLKDMIIENGFHLANEIDGVSKDMMNMIISLIFTLKVPKSEEEL
ncbi:MAG: hypothetical protein ACW98K_03625 [Candidatus Kariarchaeaceae archaeon]|jgi:hypothetical protein